MVQNRLLCPMRTWADGYVEPASASGRGERFGGMNIGALRIWGPTDLVATITRPVFVGRVVFRPGEHRWLANQANVLRQELWQQELVWNYSVGTCYFRQKGNIRTLVNKDGLNNNTVLSLEVDDEGNIGRTRQWHCAHRL